MEVAELRTAISKLLARIDEIRDWLNNTVGLNITNRETSDLMHELKPKEMFDLWLGDIRTD